MRAAQLAVEHEPGLVADGAMLLACALLAHAFGTLRIDLLPQRDLDAELKAAKQQSRRQLGNQLSEWLPQRLLHFFDHTT